jgi:CheY-like chemotaxis protein/HAMP domain-containing protein
MSLLRNMSIRTKLILISLIPVFGLLYYLQATVRKELSNKEAAQQVMLDVAVMDKLSTLIHELQMERALIVGYISFDGKQTREVLLSQRPRTDKAILELNTILANQNRNLENLWLLDSLPTLRMRANTLQFDDADNAIYLQGKTLMLEEINKILRSSKNQNLKNYFEDHLFLLYAKDYLGVLRGSLLKAIIDGKFSTNDYGRFSYNKGKYEVNLQKLRKLASPEIHEFFENKFRNPFVTQMNSCLEKAFSDPEFSTLPCTSNDWYNNVTASINLLKEVEDFSGVFMRNKAEQQSALANNNVVRTILIACFIILLIIVAVAFTIKDIVTAITKIKNAADQMARGDVAISLDLKSKDEIGNLADSFTKMIGVTKELSLIAERIGKGDYSSSIPIRGSSDVLGVSLETMRVNLENLSRENFIRNWLLSGNAELNDKMRGEKDIKMLAQDVVIQLVTYLKAQIGAIYLLQNGHLELTGSYAFHQRKGNTNTFKVGQGLVGQAALEKKVIVFSDVPDDYIKINSGLGQTSPKNIIVFPFLYEGDIKGVIEIGAARQFSDLDLQFLSMVGDNIAIAFNASSSRTVLKDLLEETQRQAEELETQQEELKQSNEELIEKTQLLERSEAELKAQQEELQQTNEELEEKANLLETQKSALEETKMEIENKARELEDISKYKSEFLANMSHELRTPLNSILILSQLLADNKNGVLREKEAEFATNIFSSGTDLLNLINEILDLSKVESGKMEMDYSNVSFGEITSDVTSMFAEVARSKSIDFKMIVDEQVKNKIIHTDKLRLEQIIRNLLSNAFKFTAKGGNVSLTIAKPSALVSFKDSRLNSSNSIAFTVKDSGIGIPREKQGIIFEAFQQADGSTKRKYGGTGLGLSICRELTIALGGEIHLESQQNEGSSFTLYLPINHTHTPAVHAPKIINHEIKRINQTKSVPPSLDAHDVADDRNAIHENDKTVLIMEDDIDFGKLILGFIRDRGYKGIVAQQGNTGLSYARHYKPDAIILDMKLPIMDGAEVLRQLKNDPALRHIPVQIISGYDRRKEGLELGAIDYVRKPISFEAFQKAFDRIEDFISRKLKKLLIVEDNELQNRAIRELLGNGDVKCYSSYSGQEAFDMLKKEKFDCTIVDLGLPDMTGFELLEKIKGDDVLNKIPTIVYTGKDLTKEESFRLNKLANTVVLKTADSKERLLDETILFLHQVESKLPKEKQNIIRKLHKTDEVLKDKQVLVVDDDIRNIYSLTNVLEEEGMKCLVAENGNVAINMLKENPSLDIILMDVMMPEMDGYDATKTIRKIPKFEKLPIIALTAKAMKGDREKCLAAGMSDYISKPVNIEQLISLMRVWLYK